MLLLSQEADQEVALLWLLFTQELVIARQSLLCRPRRALMRAQALLQQTGHKGSVSICV